MDYIGSKEKLNDWIFSKILGHRWVISKTIMNIQRGYQDIVFLDACAGSGSTSIYAATKGLNVVSNDIMEFPKHIVEGVINLTIQQFKEAEQHIDKMNNLPSVEGFYYKNYSQSAGRLYFTDKNAKKIDACRQYINTIQNQTVRSYLLSCLIEALSKVSNTTGVQGSFLKNLKDRAVQPLTVKAKRAYFTNNVKAYSRDVVELMKSSDYRGQYRENIIFIDPPYNERQYGSNYHLYETLVRYDDPIISGKGGVRNWQAESKSLFCTKQGCLDHFKEAIDLTTANVIYISYSSDGLVPIKEFEEFILDNQLGELCIHVTKQRRYKADNNRKNNGSFLGEYLIEITRA